MPNGMTPDYYSSAIRATLSTTAPGLSCEIGTPERKIIDAVSEAISEASISQYLTGSMMNVDTKTGLELDEFVGLFGFGRLQGKPATGIVRVALSQPSTSDVTVGQATQFYTIPALPGVSATLYFASTQAAVISAGNISADIPVQCTSVGSVGNVPPGSIAYLGSIIGASTCTNLSPMTGGVDPETDDALRQRFKDTFLRNSAGTVDYYKAIALQNNAVSRVALYGPTTLYSTQIVAQVGTVALVPTYVPQNVLSYAWAGMESVFTELGTADETFYTPTIDYIYQAGIEPTLTVLPSSQGGSINPNDILDIEFQYVSQASRNDPLADPPVTNKVDMYVDGITPVSVTETTAMPSAAQRFVSDPGSAYYYKSFVRIDGTPVEVGNTFQRLGSVPLVSFPSQILVGDGSAATPYVQGTDFFVAVDATTNAGSNQEVSGLEWTASAPAVGSTMQLSYSYNQTPQIIQAVIDTQKQITTDVMVHAADSQALLICLSVEYSRNYSRATVDSSISTRMKQYFTGVGFGATIKPGNILLAVLQVLGVADADITVQSDATTDSNGREHWGIEFYDALDTDTSNVQRPFTQYNNSSTGGSLLSEYRLGDNQLPTLLGVVTVRKPNS